MSNLENIYAKLRLLNIQSNNKIDIGMLLEWDIEELDVLSKLLNQIVQERKAIKKKNLAKEIHKKYSLGSNIILRLDCIEKYNPDAYEEYDIDTLEIWIKAIKEYAEEWEKCQ